MRQLTLLEKTMKQTADMDNINVVILRWYQLHYACLL